MVGAEFQAYISDAVRTQCSTWDVTRGDEHEQVEARRIEGMKLEVVGNGCLGEDDVVFVEERPGEGACWDSPEGLSAGGPGAAQRLEEDFELALRLQEEEGRLRGERRGGEGDRRRASHNVWGNGTSDVAWLATVQGKDGRCPSGIDQTGIPWETNGQGERDEQRIRDERNQVNEDLGSVEEFPSLASSSSSHGRPAAPPVTLECRGRRAAHLPQDSESTADTNEPRTSGREDFAGLTKLSGLQGLLVDNLKFHERQAVLDHTYRVLQAPTSSGITMDRMKAMMAKSSKDAAKLSHCERLLRDGPSRDTFSRKSMEKLKSDMLAVGWVNVRHATHLVYRREMPVPKCCGIRAPLVQRTVVACTPSSPHTISRVFLAVYKAEVELYDTLLAMKDAEDARLEGAAKVPT